MLSTALVVALIGVVSYNVGKFAFKKDDKQERFAEHLLDLSAALQTYGLKDIPRGMRLAAIKDVSGVVELIKFYVELIKRDPDAVMVEFDKIFERVLEAKLKNPDATAALRARVAEPVVSKVIVTDAK